MNGTARGEEWCEGIGGNAEGRGGGQYRPCCGAYLAGPSPTRLGPAQEPAPRKGRLCSHVSTPTLHSPMTRTMHSLETAKLAEHVVRGGTTAIYHGEQTKFPQFRSFLHVSMEQMIGKGWLMVGAWSGRLHAYCKQAQNVNRSQTAQTGGSQTEHNLPLQTRHWLQMLLHSSKAYRCIDHPNIVSNTHLSNHAGMCRRNGCSIVRMKQASYTPAYHIMHACLPPHKADLAAGYTPVQDVQHRMHASSCRVCIAGLVRELPFFAR